MIHVDPASHRFVALPKYQQARIYRSGGWTLEAIADELDITRQTASFYCTPGRVERHQERKNEFKRSEAGKAQAREQAKRRRAKKKEAA